ncbi:sulfite exporter TauE/SafE family protein [Pandoraea sputorum]|uniref:Probable membrane transporter protein n=1 Tax=Pandoraea sputorum TaxID=93222 RepID=A0A239SNZ5_9BURK|nr:sulfite exporter TauE/SafE family protein [Pandoraea sputorum]SNU87181.1 Sulfite exporter TauE/SafE [Pandoraea sputorum]VVE25536.1 sulfite exporter TauE/SafE family protein [Pandoraea sputorum]
MLTTPATSAIDSLGSITAALPTPGHWLLMSAALVVAYVIFGIAGFGTALVASPILAYAMPVAQIVPMLALLDFSAASGNVLRNARAADMSELRRLLPAIVLGSLAGGALLLRLQPEVLLKALAWFVCAYAVFSLIGPRAKSRLSQAWAIPFGAVGGMFGAMFGSGGFVFAIYLTSRLERVEAMRVTQATLIGFSTLARAVLFLLAGVYANVSMLVTAVSLVPAMIVGMWLGKHITLRLSRQQFVRAVNFVVLAAGIALLIRSR